MEPAPTAQAKTLSHRGEGQPIPSLHRPQEIFSRLFDPYGKKSIEEVRANLKREASILDLLMEDSKSLKGRLGKEDQVKMDEYLESIRSLEQRVERTSEWTHKPLPNVDTKGLNLEVSHKDPQEYIRCMYDLVFLGFQTDSTRFASLMLESESLLQFGDVELRQLRAGLQGSHPRHRPQASQAELRWQMGPSGGRSNTCIFSNVFGRYPGR